MSKRYKRRRRVRFHFWRAFAIFRNGGPNTFREEQILKRLLADTWG
jgi:hypothetical protein